jgi:predicted negative regulator of RcsB-dependent stress response
MVEVYDAHEQGEVVKKWLKDNGSAMVMGLVIAFGGLFGFKQWQVWEVSNQHEAFAEFEVLNSFLSEGQLDAAVSNFQNLKENHAKSPYAALAALQMGRARLEAAQPDLAIANFQYVMDQGTPRAIRVVGRERLARLLLDQERAEEALGVIDGETDISGFEARFAETRGDIFKALDRNDEAIAAYQDALDSLEAGAGDRATLVLKLESLGVIQDDEAGST